jgi:hypothetical protein
MSNLINPKGQVTVTVPAGESIAVYTQGWASVSVQYNPVIFPGNTGLLGQVNNGQSVFGPFASGATVIIEASIGAPAFYEIGTSPIVQQGRVLVSEAVVTSNIADGGSMAFTPAHLLGGIVTATPTTGRNIQLPTGSALEAAADFQIGQGIYWSVVTLAAFALTATVNTGHTIVGAAATAGTSGAAARFVTVKSAANTFVTTRVS